MGFLYLCAFLMDAATAALLVVRSPFAISLQASAPALGLLGAVGTLPYMFSCLLFGRASDHYGRRRVLTAGVLALLPLWGLMPRCQQVWQFGLLVGLWSFFLGAFWPTLQAWIGDLRPAGQVAGGVRGFNLGWSIGVMIGSLIGGCGPLVPFTFGGGSCLVILLLASRVPEAPKDRQSASGTEEEEPEKSGERRNGATGGEEPEKVPGAIPPLLLLGWVSNAASYFVLGSIYSLFPKLAESLQLSGWLWASLAFLLGGGRVVSFLVGGAFPRWFYRPLHLFLNQAVLLAALGLLAGGSSTVPFAIAFVLIGGGVGFSYFWSLLHSLEGTARKGRYASYHEAVLRTGDFTGALLAGVVVAQTSWFLPNAGGTLALRTPYLLAGLLVVGVSVWQAGFLSRAREGVMGRV